MTIVPSQFDGVVSDGADFLKLRARHGDESPLRSVALTKRARTITAKIFLSVVTRVAVVPSDPYAATGSRVVNLSRKK